MDRITELIGKRIELMHTLRELEGELQYEVLRMSPDILLAWAEGIVKFNFPTSAGFRRAVLDKVGRAR